MKIKELADLVGITPRTIRHYHHEGLLAVPDNSGVRDYTLDHAVRLVRIRHLTESGLSLGTIRDMLQDPAMSVEEELTAAETAIDERIAELELQKTRLRELRARRGSDGVDPLPYTVPGRLAWFYDQVEPHLSAEARSYFETERRAMEVAVRIPYAARIIENWLADFSPERLQATVDIYDLFARLPEMDEASAAAECKAALPRFRRVFGEDWGIRGRSWRLVVRPVLTAPGVLALLFHAYPHPNQQAFIHRFLEEVVDILDGGVSRETSGVEQR